MSGVTGLRWDSQRVKWVQEAPCPTGMFRDDKGHLYVDRPLKEQDMTLFQRVGAVKEMAHGVSKMELIDDMALSIIELEAELARIRRYEDRVAEAAGL